MRMVGLTALVATMCVTACNTLRPSPTENEVRAQVAEVQPASVADTLAVTYLCGNIFRVRNPRTEEELIRWSLNNTQPRATLRTGARHEGQLFRDTYVDAGGVGAFWYLTRTLLRSVAHGGLPVCAPPTAALPLSPDNKRSVLGYLDTTYTVTHPADGSKIFRRQVAVRFRASTNPALIHKFFDDFRARAFYGRSYSAGEPLYEFGLSIPDPGPSYSALEAVMQLMDSSPGVVTVSPLWSGESTLVPARFPTDAHAARADYLEAPSANTWHARAIRLPQAWSCDGPLLIRRASGHDHRLLLSPHRSTCS
jgi:hypothetical protein